VQVYGGLFPLGSTSQCGAGTGGVGGVGAGGPGHSLSQACFESVPEAAWHLLSTHLKFVCVHPAVSHASCVWVPLLSGVHLPSVLQLYICVGAGGGVGGTHVVAQLVLFSAPDPAVHVLVAGSLHV
jgi:hypothetical protein